MIKNYTVFLNSEALCNEKVMIPMGICTEGIIMHIGVAGWERGSCITAEVGSGPIAVATVAAGREIWLNFFSPILAHFAHFSFQSPRWVSFCPDGVSLCPEHHHQPLFFTQQSQTPFGDTNKHKSPQPHPKIPLFLAWTWKWAKWTTVPVSLWPLWAGLDWELRSPWNRNMLRISNIINLVSNIIILGLIAC